jgi:peptide/nickel transport system substrate-binding protein
VKIIEKLKGKSGRRTKDLTAAHVLRVSKQRALPSLRQWAELPRVLSKKEKRLAWVVILLTIVSLAFLVTWFVITHRTESPAVGGTYTEGLIGEPQFVNPIYAPASDVDSDLTELVYSGIFRYDPVSGLVPDLASSFEISEDQTTYTITIRDDARWHDGQPVRASDIVFTIKAIQNPEYKSPLQVTFHGVSVAEIDEKQVQFTLLEPFAPFLASLTVGIIPSHIWEEVSPKRATLTDLNLSPIGSGAYKFEKYTKDKNGNIGSYTLVRNPDYYNTPANIEELVFKFYTNANSAVDALVNRNIEGLAFVPANLTEEVNDLRGVEILTPSLPQVTALFINQQANELLEESDVRQALALATDKQAIVDQVFSGSANVIHAPVLPGMIGYHENVEKYDHDPEAAKALLVDHMPEDEDCEDDEDCEGSEEPKIELTLTVLDQPEFISTAEILQTQWAQVGITLEIQVVSAMDLSALVLSDRNYELFLTGELLGIDPDPYPFWHSSQAEEPGLNLSCYTNRKADELLEEARTNTDPDQRSEKYIEFQDYLAEDIPAIFLYQPSYRYAIASKIENVSIEQITVPADRFARINEWYTKTKMALSWEAVGCEGCEGDESNGGSEVTTPETLDTPETTEQLGPTQEEVEAETEEETDEGVDSSEE